MTDNNKTGFDAEFSRLERRIEELLINVDSLKEENRACDSARSHSPPNVPRSRSVTIRCARASKR
jgi:hypothetical protein